MLTTHFDHVHNTFIQIMKTKSSEISLVTSASLNTILNMNLRKVTLVIISLYWVVRACVVVNFTWGESRNNLNGAVVDNGVKVCWLNLKDGSFRGDWAVLDCLPGWSAAIHKNPWVLRYTPPDRTSPEGDMLAPLNVGINRPTNRFIKYITGRHWGC